MTRRLWMLAAIAFCLVYWLLLTMILAPEVIWKQSWGTEEKRVMVERMKYHGTDWAICEGADCYFYRNGKRCRL